MATMLDEKTILIGYDSSEGSRRAIATAGELFPGAKSIVLHAWSPISLMVAAYGGMVALPDEDNALQESAAKVAAEGCRLALEAGLKAQPEITEVTYQGTAHTILDVAEQYDADVIVLGARGLSTFKSMMLGSVSHSIAQHAHIPVLVVPPAVPADATAQPAGRAAATA
jgi:nucleotide-binding universal stress UspA family protein